ncbi:MAG: 1-acyl-sn-glycerol-3-phosphate acyltransferase [Desulfotomaculum sp.]|nr:1-acyl-sn-glycerol-3-phosphate acyltransferase [Desulfotomaculum sp.]
MLRTVMFLICFFRYMMYSFFKLIKINRLAKQGREREAEQLAHHVVKKWARALIKATGSTVEVKGLENVPPGNVLFICNHQGYFDILLLISCIDKPKGFIAKKELKNIPVINVWMKKINCVFIDRSNLRQSMKAMLESVKLLKKGKSMVLFPEGTRSQSDKLGKFKPAGIKTALKSQVPIVPVTINGSYKIYEENKFFVKPANVKVVVSKPIYVNQMTKEEKENLPEKLREIIASNL